MTARRIKAQLHFLLLIPLAAFLYGCTPTRPGAYRSPSAPPPLPYQQAPDVSQPPEFDSVGYYSHELPVFLFPMPERLPDPSPVAGLLRQADAHFQEGRRLLRQGKPEDARREFDLAVEALLNSTVSGPAKQQIYRKLHEIVEAVHQLDLSDLASGEAEGDVAYEESPLDEIPELTFPIDPKLRHQVAEQLRATVSQLPLEINDDVLRYLDYFSNGRGRKTFLNGMRRSGRYRPLINRILDEEGIPQEMIHLAQAESGFAPRAISRKKATGMWQFMQFRGEQYGLKRTKQYDERLDPEKATRAAARHLHDLYTEFGDWYLAMAAYNCGPLCVARAVERTGYADFWELRRRGALPKETGNYVPIILAMVILAKNPAQFGIEEIELEQPLEYSTIELDSPVHLALVGDITDRSVGEIRDLNPALLTNVAPAGYSLHVPAGSGPAVVAALRLIPPDRRTEWRLCRVSEGDTLASLARLYKTTPQKIAEVNALNDQTPSPGSLLIIPAPPQRSTLMGSSSAAKAVKQTRQIASRTKTGSAAQTSSAAKKKPASATGKPQANAVTVAAAAPRPTGRISPAAK